MPKLFNKRNFAHIYSVAKVSTNKMEKIHYLKSVLLENKNYCIWNDSEIKSTGNRSYLGLLKIISCVYIMVDPGITQVYKHVYKHAPASVYKCFLLLEEHWTPKLPSEPWCMRSKANKTESPSMGIQINIPYSIMNPHSLLPTYSKGRA